MARSGARPSFFMLGPSPRKYFQDLEKTSSTGKFKILLQKYWLCAQVGMAYGVMRDREARDKWVQDYFPEPLKSNQHLIRALCFFMDAQKKGYGPDDEDDLLNGMKAFFDDEAQTKLTPEAVHIMNRYAAAGFEIIKTKIPNPTDLAVFLVDYVNLLKDADKARSKTSQ